MHSHKDENPNVFAPIKHTQADFVDALFERLSTRAVFISTTTDDGIQSMINDKNNNRSHIYAVPNAFIHKAKSLQKNEHKHFNIDISQTNNLINEIRIHRFYAHKDYDLPGTAITFIGKKGEKQTFFIPFTEASQEFLDEVDKYAENSPNLELVTPKSSRLNSIAFSSDFWKREKSVPNWDEVTDHKEHYVNVSDPIFIEKLNQILSARNNNKPLVIIDIGGGKGRLAAELIMAADKLGVNVEYILVEPDNSQCLAASKTLHTLSSEQKHKIKIKKYTFEKYMEEYGKKMQNQADIVISSGGPLNAQVVSHKDAVNNLRDMATLLAPGGKLLATGLSPLLVTKKDFKSNGLRVVSATHKSSATDMPIQFYVCEKPRNELREDASKSRMFSEPAKAPASAKPGASSGKVGKKQIT